MPILISLTNLLLIISNKLNLKIFTANLSIIYLTKESEMFNEVSINDIKRHYGSFLKGNLISFFFCDFFMNGKSIN